MTTTLKITKLKENSVFQINRNNINKIIRKYSFSSFENEREMLMETNHEKIISKILAQTAVQFTKLQPMIFEDELTPIRRVQDCLADNIQEFYKKISFEQISNEEVSKIFFKNNSTFHMQDNIFEFCNILKRVILKVIENKNKNIDKDLMIREFLDMKQTDQLHVKFINIRIKHAVELYQIIEEYSYDDEVEKNMPNDFKETSKKKIKLKFEFQPNLYRLMIRYLKIFVVRYINTKKLEKEFPDLPNVRIGKIFKTSSIQLLNFQYIFQTEKVIQKDKSLFKLLERTLKKIPVRCRYIYTYIKQLKDRMIRG
jgi:hypothetical protein